MKPGFTLLEVLVGLAILGLVLGGIAAGARFGLGAAARQEAASSRQGDLDAVDRALRRVVAEADPAGRLVGSPGALSLLSTVPEPGDAAPAPAQVGLGLEPGGDLVLRWVPAPGGRPLGPPPRPLQAVLLRHVARIVLAYWPRGAAAGWRPAWDEAGLPALIRLRIEFDRADGRTWPELVMAPMRDAAAGSRPPPGGPPGAPRP